MITLETPTYKAQPITKIINSIVKSFFPLFSISILLKGINRGMNMNDIDVWPEGKDLPFGEIINPGGKNHGVKSV